MHKTTRNALGIELFINEFKQSINNTAAVLARGYCLTEEQFTAPLINHQPNLHYDLMQRLKILAERLEPKVVTSSVYSRAKLPCKIAAVIAISLSLSDEGNNRRSKDYLSKPVERTHGFER